MCLLLIAAADPGSDQCVQALVVACFSGRLGMKIIVILALVMWFGLEWIPGFGIRSRSLEGRWFSVSVPLSVVC